MIHFFKKIRRQLLSENKTTRYVKYAIGEVILIMLGIFMALQLQNWNEKRKQEIQFKTTLEQIYNAVDKDIYKVENTIHYLSKQGKLIETLLYNPDSIPKNKLLTVLFYLDTQPSEMTKTEIAYQFSVLAPNPNSSVDNEITKQISGYVGWNDYDLKKENSTLISDYLFNQGIPKLYLTFGFAQINNFTQYDSNYFSTNEIEKVTELLNTEDMKKTLKGCLAYKEYVYFHYNSIIQDGESIKQMIKGYHPEVKLLYKDIGIIGDAIGDWENSIPMTLIDEKHCIWELATTLKDGRLKFRSRNSWNENWGGTKFPSDTALYYGEDITVKAGNYKITLNLSNKTYEFIKIE